MFVVRNTKAAGTLLPKENAMYVPRHFAVEDRRELLRFMERHPFAILVSTTDRGPVATHVPIVVSRHEPLTLALHIARANPQWKGLEGQTVLAIFQGAHAMISASWYVEPRQNVPTWNYSAVHCTGTARVSDDAGTRRIVAQVVDRMEPAWRIEDADAGYIARMEGAIVGIQIDVAQITGSYKYSENRSAEDRKRVIQALEASSNAMDREVAEIMRAMPG
jgi:transcriptional regulator